MFVYTICFTLENKKPSENHYIDLLIIWLTYAKKNAGLKKGDYLIVYVDKVTFDYLNILPDITQFIYGDAHEYDISFQLFDQPKTLSEGMTYKYRLFQKEIPNDVYVYLDIDCFILRSIHDYQKFYKRDNEGIYMDYNDTIFRNTLCLMPKGLLSDTSYCGNLIEITSDLKEKSGYSAGHFVFTSSYYLRELFKRIISSIEAHEMNPQYSLDQPILNHEIIQLYRNVNNVDFAIIELDNRKIDVNVINKSVSDAYLLNLCGEPGDGKKHFLKAIFRLCNEYKSLT
jgi:hypothetical protein